MFLLSNFVNFSTYFEQTPISVFLNKPLTSAVNDSFIVFLQSFYRLERWASFTTFTLAKLNNFGFSSTIQSYTCTLVSILLQLCSKWKYCIRFSRIIVLVVSFLVSLKSDLAIKNLITNVHCVYNIVLFHLCVIKQNACEAYYQVRI